MRGKPIILYVSNTNEQICNYMRALHDRILLNCHIPCEIRKNRLYFPEIETDKYLITSYCMTAMCFSICCDRIRVRYYANDTSGRQRERFKREIPLHLPEGAEEINKEDILELIMGDYDD